MQRGPIAKLVQYQGDKTMMLNPECLAVSEIHSNDLFFVRRQMRSDNVLDFQAVTTSRQALRVWSDSDWPQDEFTIEENAADLDMHIDEHERDEAYGFSIFDVAQSTLMGSLYLNQGAAIVENYQVDSRVAAYLRNLDVCADYWLRQGVSQEIETAFFQTVQAWLSEAWWFTNVAFGSQLGKAEQRRQYLDAGLNEVAVLTKESEARRFHLHARNSIWTPPRTCNPTHRFGGPVCQMGRSCKTRRLPCLIQNR